MFLEQNIGHLKALFSGVWEDRKMRIQILNMLKGSKYVTFYLLPVDLSYSCYLREVFAPRRP